MTTTAMEEVKGNALTTPTEDFGDMGGITQSDLQIPQLQLIQKKSKVEEAEKAKAGDIYDSMEDKAIGNAQDPVEFIPLSVTKAWRIFDMTNPQKPDYIETVPFGPANADWTFEGTGVNNEPIKRQLVSSWNVLLVKQIAVGDPMVYRVNFKGSSFSASKKLATMIAKGTFLKLPIFGKTYKLGVEKKTNDHGTFFAFDVVAGRKTTDDEIGFAKLWINMLNTKKVEEIPTGEVSDAYEG